MSKICRTDEFAIDEKGPSWFDAFLQSIAANKIGGYQDILDIINNKSHKSIESLIKNYREQCGLDALGEDLDEEITKSASGIGPIAPMKLKKLESLDDMLKDNKPEDLIVQMKFDGFKTQAIKTEDKVKLFTRRGEEFTENVPELVEQLDKVMDDNSFILGELVWEDKNGKQSISDLQTVVSSSADKAHAKIKEGDGKVVFYVYDLLWDNNQNITRQKYIDRYNIVKKSVGKQSNIKVAENYTWEQKDMAIKDALTAGGEGIVIKPKDSEYKYAPKGQNEPHGEQVKFKPESKAHVDEVILNKYHKDNIKLIFPAYQHKGEELVEVGQVSGMSKEDEEKIKKDIDSGKSVVVEVSYQERMPSGKFRHMAWSRFRPDKSTKEVKMASFRSLSVRHAETKNIVSIITNDPELKKAIDSFCEHSGGHKSTHSMIQYLREKLGHELVRFSDKDLIAYIEDKKKGCKHLTTEEDIDVGRVGIDENDYHDDDVADYVSHSNIK